MANNSFVGGPKVHFPDVDQESDEDDANEAEADKNIGKFERHDTPHPKHHGPKPKGRQIDGHVIHHDEADTDKVRHKCR